MTTTGPELTRLLDEAEIKALALGYARGCDRRDREGLMALFTSDGAISGSGISMVTPEVIAKTIAGGLAAHYDQTYHMVYNHLVDIRGDEAEGEVYSMAHHLKRQDDGRTSDLIMTITYRDQYVRQEGSWRIRHRVVERKWTQLQWVDPEPQR